MAPSGVPRPLVVTLKSSTKLDRWAQSCPPWKVWVELGGGGVGSCRRGSLSVVNLSSVSTFTFVPACLSRCLDVAVLLLLPSRCLYNTKHLHLLCLTCSLHIPGLLYLTSKGDLNLNHGVTDTKNQRTRPTSQQMWPHLSHAPWFSWVMPALALLSIFDILAGPFTPGTIFAAGVARKTLCAHGREKEPTNETRNRRRQLHRSIPDASEYIPRIRGESGNDSTRKARPPTYIRVCLPGA